MDEAILREEDVDGVLFLGKKHIDPMVFDKKYLTTPGFSNIVYGSQHFFGMKKDWHMAENIENDRIKDKLMLIGGKRFLIVTADIHSINKNQSFLDYLTEESDLKLKSIRAKYQALSNEKGNLIKFLEDRELETSWQEWLENQVERARNILQKLKPVSEAPPPSVEVKLPEKPK